ncbi:transcription elongation factor NusA [Actinobacillus pleuropneumoniae]|nr:transcription elongation factor NusA [Actinobacillus pleuropneumoniae]
MSMDFIEAMNELEREKGISKDVLFEAIEAALISSYKRNFNTAQNVRVDMNRNTGVIKVFARKLIVDEVLDPRTEISLHAHARSIRIFKSKILRKSRLRRAISDGSQLKTAKQVVTPAH